MLFKCINIRKAALKTCANQLADIFKNILNLSLSVSTVPTCFKSTVIIPVPKKSKVTCPNNWRHVAFTPIMSKYREKLIKVQLQNAASHPGP